MVLDFPVSESLSSAVLRVRCVSSNVLGVDDAVFTFLVRDVLFFVFDVIFFVRSNLCVGVSSTLHVCVCISGSVGVFLSSK